MKNYCLYCYHHGLPHSEYREEYYKYIDEMTEAINDRNYCDFMDALEALMKLGFSSDKRFVGYDESDTYYDHPEHVDLIDMVDIFEDENCTLCFEVEHG